ncbi:MAG: DUF2071 domain-containing protein [Pirellulaceae bacterium]|jgi:hypothetical protein|nr:DUF2071 domain-containing protein [Pirellulaceae bacterium]
MLHDSAHARQTFLSARWHALAMLNYEVEPALLAPLVPRGTSLDLEAGRAYVSLVGFLFLHTRVLRLPIPGHCHFEEVNLRFYVKREVGGEARRGVAFIKEIVPRWAIAATARWAYNEPYVALPMRHEISGPAAELIRESCGFRTAAPASDAGARQPVVYRWRLAGHWNSLSVGHAGAAATLLPDSHEAFIAEHYWGYCRQRDGGTVEYRVVHPSWRIWHGIDPQVDCDAEALYGRVWADVLTARPTSAFVADGSEVAVLRPTRIC